MELYYKDLISKEASLENLVENLMLVVQGADEFAQAAGSGIGTERHKELVERLHKLKAGCIKIREQTKATALAADKVVRQYPYSAIGFAFGAGLLTAILLRRSSSRRCCED